jgi:hypothetical protein
MNHTKKKIQDTNTVPNPQNTIDRKEKTLDAKEKN